MFTLTVDAEWVMWVWAGFVVMLFAANSAESYLFSAIVRAVVVLKTLITLLYIYISFFRYLICLNFGVKE